MTIASVTRIWNGSKGLPDRLDVERWVDNANTFSESLIVAVDETAREEFTAYFTDKGVHQIPIQFWFGYSLILNALVQQSAKLGHNHLFIQSVDIAASKQDIVNLMSHMQEDTLVVGARLAPSHGGKPGIVPLNGRTSPWNTFAIWNIQRLSMLGFQGVSDAVMTGGMEEVVTIALHQRLFPDMSKAKLLPLGHHFGVSPGSGRDSNHFESKLEWKNRRANSQLVILGLDNGLVHVLPEVDSQSH
jgi:hypothetical protein